MIKKILLCLSAFIVIMQTILTKAAYIINIKHIWIPFVTFIICYFGMIIFYFIIIFIISLTINTKKEYYHQNKFYLFIFNITLEFIINLAHIKLITNGLNKINLNEKFFLVTNHKSNFDPMIECMVLKKNKLVEISKPGNFKIPIAGPFMRRCCFPEIDRKNNRNALKTILQAIDYIKKNELSIGIAPEGTRNFGEGLLPFKPGCFKIGLKSGAPLVVCTIKNTEKIKKNFPFKKTIVYMNIVEVIPYDNYKNMTTLEISDMVRELMAKDLGISEETTID